MSQLLRHAVYFHKPVRPSLSTRALRRKARIELPLRDRPQPAALHREGLQPLPGEHVLQWVRAV
eukprot:2007727-Rhodomonas_salina.1